ncbi:MAG: CotH kinase family protein [Oligoflexia bacterium]|nr:CotH kinase family protein [Oligoflexia bacterium]MBF0365091.1 CotH kinase family protein [Oligoflexia bacterium]
MKKLTIILLTLLYSYPCYTAPEPCDSCSSSVQAQTPQDHITVIKAINHEQLIKQATAYEENGELQKALWVYKELKMDKEAARLEKQAITTLTKETPKQVIANEASGKIQSKIVLYKSSIKAIKKPNQSPRDLGLVNPKFHAPSTALSEVAAYQMDQLLQLNRIPLTILKEKRFSSKSSLQLFVQAHDAKAVWDKVPAEEKILIAAFDYLIQNSDRSKGHNLLYYKDENDDEKLKFVYIDHDAGFKPQIQSDIQFVKLPQIPQGFSLLENSLLDRFYKNLSSLTEKEIQTTFKSTLNKEQIQSILSCRQNLLKQFHNRFGPPKCQ